jgi:3-methyladenine DNA glycosylase AlkC
MHPAVRFEAPATIPTGVPLKAILSPKLIQLIGESVRRVWPKFPGRVFAGEAADGLDQLELMDRGRHIGRALARHLPGPFSRQAQTLVASMGPELTRTEGNGLAVFFYLPHSFFISECGLEDVSCSLAAMYEVTKRFTAEFCIRPFLVRYRDVCLSRLRDWARDPSPHVRRLVSEGTRPRLPWALRLTEFQRNPHFTLPLLELLKDDPEPYVRRSVANHIGDILKDSPETGFAVCQRWLKEVSKKSTTPAVARSRKWIVRHAVRLPAKAKDESALALREQAR